MDVILRVKATRFLDRLDVRKKEGKRGGGGGRKEERREGGREGGKERKKEGKTVGREERRREGEKGEGKGRIQG